MTLSNFETESDKLSTAHLPHLNVTRVDTSLEEKEKGMDFKPRTGLKKGPNCE